MKHRGAVLWLACALPIAALAAGQARHPLLKVRVAGDGRTFTTADGKPFVPFGVNYFRPGTGWAPQLWKKFDADATRRDFVLMKQLGVNCVRVFLTYGSFYQKAGELDPEGLARLDQFLAIAEEHGIYVHPTGPDHWEGMPEWARRDRFVDESLLAAQEAFWKLLAARYRGRAVIFAYDLLNEPHIGWSGQHMLPPWNRWLQSRYQSTDALRNAWRMTNEPPPFGQVPIPKSAEAPGDPALLDYQSFRESLADEWTRRQAAAIKAADPAAMVTVGFIQWAVPSVVHQPSTYAGFRPEQARFLDFLEIHFYPLEHGAYEYRSAAEEMANLAYLESVVREVARPGKPVVVAEFGWYGGGKPAFDGGRHPPATEEQQARWCRRLIEVSSGLAVGWLNWGLCDHPESKDVTELIGLLTSDGKTKAWGREFKTLAAQYHQRRIPPPPQLSRPAMDWNQCLTSRHAADAFRKQYIAAFTAAQAEANR